jgi:flagellar basal body rod protein FlgF
MTDQTPDIPGAADRRAQTVLWMHAIAAGLQQARLDARVHDTNGVLDIRAASDNAGGKSTDVTLDEDGYVTVSDWNDPDATTVEVIQVISRVLAATNG